MLRKFMDNISLDTNLVVFGVNETMKAIEDGALKTLIVHENLDY